MATIPLSQGQQATIDDADLALVSQFRWFYRAEKDKCSGYAARKDKVNGKVTTCYLHRFLMNPPPGREVIFLNHDKLDCRRENLHIATVEEARQHHRVRRDSQTGHKGVRYHPQ